MCSCLVTCHRHSDQTESWMENSRNLYFLTKKDTADSEKHQEAEEAVTHVSSHEGFLESPATKATTAPCYLLAKACFSTAGLCFISALPASHPFLSSDSLSAEMPHLNRLWGRLCGSHVNGGAGVLSGQGIRFLLNRLVRSK